MPTWGWVTLAIAVFVVIAALLMWGGSTGQQQAGTQANPPVTSPTPPAKSPATPPATTTPAPSPAK
jgi:hypothetical protein